MRTVSAFLPALLLSAVLATLAARADDFAARCTDRAAIERVYHARRSGTKQTFEEAMPRTLLEKLVQEDSRKETLLRKIYGVTVTPEMVDAEVQRINTTTRAPEVLTEIKHALGDDPARFAAAMARPIIVERELRRRFENDDKLHAAQRLVADQARAALLAKMPVANMKEITWHLPAPAPPAAGAPVPSSGTAKSASYTNEATAEVAKPAAAAAPDKTVPESEKLLFSDLDPQLRTVLDFQLQKPGDVSAVIEMPGAFLVFRAKARNAAVLTADSLTIPKQSYEQWLAQLPR